VSEPQETVANTVAGIGGLVSEFDNLKNEAEQFAVKEGEQELQNKFGIGGGQQGQQGYGQDQGQGYGQDQGYGQGSQDQYGGSQDQYGEEQQQSGY